MNARACFCLIKVCQSHNFTHHYRHRKVPQVWPQFSWPAHTAWNWLMASGAMGSPRTEGTHSVCLVDSRGQRFKTVLRNALYIPIYPQDIFSVKAATSNRATVIFREGKNVLLHRDGTKFPIHVHNKLYYLHTKDNECVDQCKKCNDLQTWREILGQCNYVDIIKPQDVVDGMEIRSRKDKSVVKCVCRESLFRQQRARCKSQSSSRNGTHRFSRAYRPNVQRRS